MLPSVQVPKALHAQSSSLSRFGEEATSKLTDIGVLSSASSGRGKTRRLFLPVVEIDFTVINHATLHLFENNGVVVAIWGGLCTFIDRTRTVKGTEKNLKYICKTPQSGSPYSPTLIDDVPTKKNEDGKSPDNTRKLATPLIVLSSTALVGAYGTLGRKYLLTAPLNNPTVSPFFQGGIIFALLRAASNARNSNSSRTGRRIQGLVNMAAKERGYEVPFTCSKKKRRQIYERMKNDRQFSLLVNLIIYRESLGELLKDRKTTLPVYFSLIGGPFISINLENLVSTFLQIEQAPLDGRRFSSVFVFNPN